MNVTTEEFNIDHEVRIRMLEAGIESIHKRFDKLDAKIDSNFHWVLGTIIVFFGSIVLHMAHLI